MVFLGYFFIIVPFGQNAVVFNVLWFVDDKGHTSQSFIFGFCRLQYGLTDFHNWDIACCTVLDVYKRQLQNQINAHFIYNVLESIKMMAEIDEE